MKMTKSEQLKFLQLNCKPCKEDYLPLLNKFENKGKQIILWSYLDNSHKLSEYTVGYFVNGYLYTGINKQLDLFTSYEGWMFADEFNEIINF